MKSAAASLTVGLLLIVCAACGSSAAKTTSSSLAKSSKSASTTSTSINPTSGGDTSTFCALLATDADKTAAFAAAIGTPQQPAKLAEVKADNDAIVASAPSGVRAAVTKFYQVSSEARAALDPTLSLAEKQSAGARAAAAASSPDVKTAISDYKAWVQSHCGALSAKILSGGV